VGAAAIGRGDWQATSTKPFCLHGGQAMMQGRAAGAGQPHARQPVRQHPHRAGRVGSEKRQTGLQVVARLLVLSGRTHSAKGRMSSLRLRFADFKDAFGFATRIALVAEEEGHHPDMEIGWGKVVVSLTTHSSGGLTPNDFIMAAKVDRLAAGTGLKDGPAAGTRTGCTLAAARMDVLAL
jgi:4a-hydroxytetrahydrobiopterin dehydratase